MRSPQRQAWLLHGAGGRDEGADFWRDVVLASYTWGQDAARWGAILSARSGETEDVTIVHLAVGWGVKQLKVGSFARSERMAKWNEGLRIEEALGPRAGFAGAEFLPR